MTAASIQRILLIGAGNVAYNLAHTLKAKGKEIVQVYGRTAERAKHLADLIRVPSTNILTEVKTDVDLVIVSIVDDHIQQVAESLQLDNQLIVHTSGSTPMDALKNASNNFGVFYPLQTFSKYKLISFNTIPICVEANNSENLDKLEELGSLISEDVRKLNSEQRRLVHMSAVIACNFTNHMYVLAEDLLADHDLSFDILKPLIEETANRVKDTDAHNVQTGPAVREDHETINKHLDFLKKYPEYYHIYDEISKSILKHKKRKG